MKCIWCNGVKLLIRGYCVDCREKRQFPVHQHYEWARIVKTRDKKILELEKEISRLKKEAK